ncbi:hypothetical protein MBH78_02255 [Oceanimonas sp. NS1]|nr:hypothetical protein [Oceanimonas sp. NS1]
MACKAFQGDKLKRLGRIHDPEQARFAAREAAGVGLNSFNIDLMHGLPEQRLEDALFDLEQALALAPPHLSWYQLTIEPNTPFASRPPALPEDDTLAEIMSAATSCCWPMAIGNMKSPPTPDPVSRRSTTSTTGALATTWASAAAPTAKLPCRCRDAFCAPSRSSTPRAIWNRRDPTWISTGT